MSLTIHVDVVSAEESIFSGEARFVALPGESGELGIYPRHTPLITRIKPGAVRIEKADGTEEFVFVAGGLLEVQPHCITVLSDTAIRGKDLDEAKALREEAQTLLASYERKQREVQAQADRIVENAKEEASRAAKQAKADIASSVTRRLAAAEDQITSAKAAAIRDVRNEAVAVAIAAATDVIAKQTTGDEASKLIDESIAEVGAKLH